MNLMNLANNKIVMSAVGAMMRGENPKEFMRNLANTNPMLQGLDLDNLEGTARALCDQKGIDMNQLAEQIRVGSYFGCRAGCTAKWSHVPYISQMGATLKVALRGYRIAKTLDFTLS